MCAPSKFSACAPHTLCPLSAPSLHHTASQADVAAPGVVGNGIDVRDSTLPGAGLGAFATRHYDRNELVTEYVGNLLMDKRDAAALETQTHVIHAEGVTIDGLKVYEEGKGAGSFANDPVNPARHNVIPVTLDGDAHLNKIYLKATRDIDVGDELFYSYGATRRVAMGYARFCVTRTSSGERTLEVVELEEETNEHQREDEDEVEAPHAEVVGVLGPDDVHSHTNVLEGATVVSKPQVGATHTHPCAHTPYPHPHQH